MSVPRDKSLSMQTPLSPGVARQFGAVCHAYKEARDKPHFSRAYLKVISRHLRRLIHPEDCLLEVGCGAGDLLALLPNPEKAGLDVCPEQIERARAHMPDASFHVGAAETFAFDREYDVLLLSDVLNEAGDVQQVLENLQGAAHSGTRLVANFHNTLWRPILGLATRLGLKPRHPRSNWLSSQDVANLLHLSGWEVVRQESRLLIPHDLWGMGRFINRLLEPLLPWFCLTIFIVARPIAKGLPSSSKPPSVSVLVPARNEAGNIEAILKRTPEMGSSTEIIFIEGHSSDGTWEAIQSAIEANPSRRVRAIKQEGRGKGAAMRTGYRAATGDIFMILDADMTVPPEDLSKFLEAIVSGKGEFINGVRLVYPMEEEAMRFLNMCGNKFFSLLFSWLLGQPIKDTLCGTKVFSRQSYGRIEANRQVFGEFDPFGDFDLLFGAAYLGLRIVDLPVRYQSRRYGETQINRWRDGALLFRMAWHAARRIKFV